MKPQNTFRTDRYLDTCRSEPGKAISENLMTPSDQVRQNYERLQYEGAIWKEQQKAARESTFEAICSFAIAIIAFAIMFFIISIIQ